MGGPGSGGFKNAPGDTETHAAWDVIELEDGNTQVRAVSPKVERRALIYDRNYPRYDASTVPGKWRNTLLASEHIYSTVMNTSTP
jgi:hypothetical protein